LRSFWAAGLLLGCTAGAWAETQIGLDFSLVANSNTLALLDSFDDTQLDEDWIVVSGSPGPEADGKLPMEAGDTIVHPLIIGFDRNILSVARIELTAFDEGSAAVLLLGGTERGNFVGLGVTPGFAFLFDEDGLLGGLAIDTDPRSQVLMALLQLPDTGKMVAAVNGQPFYANDDTLGRPQTYTFAVTPEPASAAALILGALTLRRRRAA
jgi:hypothetical protein